MLHFGMAGEMLVCLGPFGVRAGQTEKTLDGAQSGRRQVQRTYKRSRVVMGVVGMSAPGLMPFLSGPREERSGGVVKFYECSADALAVDSRLSFSAMNRS